MSQDVVVRGEVPLAPPSAGAAHRSQVRATARLGAICSHTVLIVASVLVLAPVVLILVNSLKTQESIFGRPFDLPIGEIEPFVRAEIARWADVVKRAGIAVQ